MVSNIQPMKKPKQYHCPSCKHAAWWRGGFGANRYFCALHGDVCYSFTYCDKHEKKEKRNANP